MSNFIVGEIREDKEDYYHLVVYQVYERGPWPPTVESDGHQWEFKGPGFMTLAEDRRFAGKAIYKVFIPEEYRDERSSDQETGREDQDGRGDGGTMDGDEGSPERPEKDKGEGPDEQ